MPFTSILCTAERFTNAADMLYATATGKCVIDWRIAAHARFTLAGMNELSSTTSRSSSERLKIQSKTTLHLKPVNIMVPGNVRASQYLSELFEFVARFPLPTVAAVDEEELRYLSCKNCLVSFFLFRLVLFLSEYDLSITLFLCS